MRSFGLWLALIGGIAGCNKGDGLVVVTVGSTTSITGINSLSAIISVGGQTRNFPVPTGGSFDVPPSKTFGVAVPHGMSGPCSVHVDAFDASGALIGSGDGATTLGAGARADIDIDLSGGVVGDDGGQDLAGSCAGDTVAQCGAACETCTTAPTNGAPACVAGMCSFTCDANYVAMSNMCVACGAVDQPCCSGSSCGAGLYCDPSNVCKVPWTTSFNAGQVYALYGTGPTDVWLGDFGGFIWHSTGGAFTKNPNALGTHLISVWASSPSDVWLAGYNPGGTFTIWHNTAGFPGTWNAVSGTPSGAGSLWGTSATDIYVAGGTGNAGSATAIIWHYPGNGSTFTVQLQTTTSGYGVQQIWGASTTALWAISGPVIFAYNGAGGWNDVTPAGVPSSTYFWSIGGTAANDVYAGAGNGLLLHWNGSAWSTVTLPASFSSLTFTGIWGSKPSDIYGAVNGGIVHFDGTKWEMQQIPAAANGNNFGVLWGSGANDIYAAGSGWVLHHP